jgi:hypothetical protein
MATTNIKGFSQVNANLNRQIKGIKNRSLAGLYEGATIIQKDMDRTPPLVPIHTGTLRQSWAAVPYFKGKQFGLIIGFTANYAALVHEDMERQFRRPGAGAKFFEASFFRNQYEVLKAVQRNAIIP